MIRVLLADDHAIVREGLIRLLGDSPDIRVVGEAGSGAEAIDALSRAAVDVVLLDVSMPGTSFTQLLNALRSGHPSVRVLVMSAHAEEEYAIRALRSGASGYLTKGRSPGELVDAIRTVAAGRRYISSSVGQLLAEETARTATRPAHGNLSDRELEVLELLGTGRSVKEIASSLALSVKTVSTYRSRLLEKLGLHTTGELIRYALELRRP